uniref:Uncharacterized protein n=1 Tax=Marmota marmota marmota TaxID=9994 RepID=A0A8C5YW38_MARMA
MALRRVFSLRSCSPRTPHLAPLSTSPATREQPAAGPRAVPGCRPVEAARPPVPVVDFSNAQKAYRSLRTWELARNLLVLRLCASPTLLERHQQVQGALVQHPLRASLPPGDLAAAFTEAAC